MKTRKQIQAEIKKLSAKLKVAERKGEPVRKVSFCDNNPDCKHGKNKHKRKKHRKASAPVVNETAEGSLRKRISRALKRIAKSLTADNASGGSLTSNEAFQFVSKARMFSEKAQRAMTKDSPHYSKIKGVVKTLGELMLEMNES